MKISRLLHAVAARITTLNPLKHIGPLASGSRSDLFHLPLCSTQDLILAGAFLHIQLVQEQLNSLIDPGALWQLTQKEKGLL